MPDFEQIREGKRSYVDKTGFIREWWDSGDRATILMRPNGFGKTFNMSMLNCFFSDRYKGRSDLFEGTKIWDDDMMRELQGKYPVIFISFADVEADTFEEAQTILKKKIAALFGENINNLERFTGGLVRSGVNEGMDDALFYNGLKILCDYNMDRCGEKTIILIDDYDVPFREAHIHGYEDSIIPYLEKLFVSTFRNNDNLARVMMAGVTNYPGDPVFGEFWFTAMTAAAPKYDAYFGFSENELTRLLGEAMNKPWLDKWCGGYSIGRNKNIYCPQMADVFVRLKQGEEVACRRDGLLWYLLLYWHNELAKPLSELLNGGTVKVGIDEKVDYTRMDEGCGVVWGYMVAEGYLRIDSMEYVENVIEPQYQVSVCNLDCRSILVTALQECERLLYC